MNNIDYFIPTRIIFGVGRLKELATIALPGNKALICVTKDGLMEKLGIQQNVIELLKQNNVSAIVFDGVTPNPTRQEVMAASQLAKDNSCDFVIGLGGGSSIDTAKAVSIVMVNSGDLWDYAAAGSGGRKQVNGAVPVVAISTTAGTGTETDPYSVVTNENTGEKLDFTLDEIFPKISIIDPSLMTSIPRDLTLFQGFDALFHAAECYVNNGGQNRLLDLYAIDAVDKVTNNLEKVLNDGNDLDARGNISYAANILCGFTQALGPCTSHHIVAQALGGLCPQVPHGAALILIAKEYYKRVQGFLPKEFDEIGAVMGVSVDVNNPGGAFLSGLTKLMSVTGADQLTMSSFGISREKLANIADIAVNTVGLDCDRYTLTEKDVFEILEKSYR